MSAYICNICEKGFQTMEQQDYHFTTPEHKAASEAWRNRPVIYIYRRDPRSGKVELLEATQNPLTAEILLDRLSEDTNYEYFIGGAP